MMNVDVCSKLHSLNECSYMSIHAVRTAVYSMYDFTLPI